MIKMSAICEEETNTISFADHGNFRSASGACEWKIPLPGIIGSIAGTAPIGVKASSF